MAAIPLPLPVLDALPLGAHRLVALTDEALFEACGVRVMFTGRQGGVSAGPFASMNTASHVGDDPAAVAQNRRLALEAACAQDADLVVLNQVHGTNVVEVHDAAGVCAAREEAGKGADAIVVGIPGVAALLNFADCLPVVIVSPSGRFAVAHAGWRGALARIAGKAARALAADDACPASAFNAYIGPHIRQECFEVGDDVASCFLDEFGEDAVPADEHVSLAAAVTADLADAGIERARIADAGVCTKCHPDRYFSYRASGGTCGRHAAFAYNAAEPVRRRVGSGSAEGACEDGPQPQSPR